MGNRKIIGATRNKVGTLTFKSKLEKSIYNTLLEQGFSPQYEPITFTLWDGFLPYTPYFDRETDKQQKKRVEERDKCLSKILVQKKEKVIGIRYTPDFYFKYNGINV